MYICPLSTSKKEALICLLSNSSCSLSILLSSAKFILHTLSVRDATLATNRLVSVNSTDYRKNREQPYYLGTWIEIFSCCELTWVWDNFWFCMVWRIIWSKMLPFHFNRLLYKSLQRHNWPKSWMVLPKKLSKHRQQAANRFQTVAHQFPFIAKLLI